MVTSKVKKKDCIPCFSSDNRGFIYEDQCLEPDVGIKRGSRSENVAHCIALSFLIFTEIFYLRDQSDLKNICPEREAEQFLVQITNSKPSDRIGLARTTKVLNSVARSGRSGVDALTAALQVAMP
jgi:hypothetical protein